MNSTIEFRIFELVYNPELNISNKIEKFSKTGQEKKSLISVSARFLTALDNVLFLEGTLGTRLYLHPNLKFS